MPGPYWAVKGKQSTTGRNSSGAAAPPPFDKGGRGGGRGLLRWDAAQTPCMKMQGVFYCESPENPKTVALALA